MGEVDRVGRQEVREDAMNKTAVRHPAKYTASLLPVFAEMIPPYSYGLDPFGGTGKIFSLCNLVPGLRVECIEIEPEWAAYDSRIMVGNALALPFENCTFDWVCTSPTYGNRMADHHNARDTSHRNTYRHALGRTLHPDNSGAMQWGEQYRNFHVAAWREVRRVLSPGGIFVLNCKNHIRRHRVAHVCEWHRQTLLDLGFELVDEKEIECPGNRFGQNGDCRARGEMVFKFALPKGDGNHEQRFVVETSK